MDSVKSVIVSTPSTVISQPVNLENETPSQQCSGQLKTRHLDFTSCSAQTNSVDSSKTKPADLSTNQLVTPLLSTARDSKDGLDSNCTVVSKATDNNKITIDKTQLTRLLEMAMLHTKAEQKKEQREKKEAEMSVKREAKKKKEEEKLRIQSEKMRHQKLQSENFRKFFKPSSNKANISNAKRQDTGWIPMFPVQPGMTLAKPPPSLKDKSKFDDALKIQEDKFVSSYVAECKGKLKIDEMISSSPGNQQNDDDVVIVEDKRRQMVKYKLLQFHENYRPAYYGTWQKISKVIQPRNPFKKDETLLDYTVDSDDEWEEEEPGESLSDCPSGDEVEDMDDEDDEDGFFVPHGYLSDGEGDLYDGETAGLPKENKEEKMKMKEKAWEIEFARKCQPVKPVCIGCCWASNGTEASRNVLLQYQAVPFTNLPITINLDQQEKATSDVRTTPKTDKPTSLLVVKSSSPQSNICYKKPVPEEAVPDLIQLLQGSSMGLEKAIKKLRVCWGRKVLADRRNGAQSGNYGESDYEQASGMSKRQIEKKIHEIAKKVDRIWQVDKSVLEKYSGINKVPSLPSRNIVAAISPQNIKHDTSVQPQLLKENLAVNENKVDTTDKQDSPARKRLKLTETQPSSPVIIT